MSVEKESRFDLINRVKRTIKKSNIDFSSEEFKHLHTTPEEIDAIENTYYELLEELQKQEDIDRLLEQQDKAIEEQSF